MKYIYVASPYTSESPIVVERNVLYNIAACDLLAEEGFIPFAPLLYHYWHQQHPHPYDFWTRLDMEWLARCDGLVRLPGASKGADAEVARAKELGIPVWLSLTSFLLENKNRAG